MRACKTSLAGLLSSLVITNSLLANAPIIEEIIVSTSSRSPKALSSEARSLSVISKDELDRIGATHISETVLRTSGVIFNRNNGQEYLASIRSPILTGAGACGAFLMAQDGIALRSAGFCNVNELFEGFTETAERIEITRGPGSALYGSNALHGIINIISPSADNNEGFASLEGGSYGYGRFNMSKGFTGKNHGLRFTASVTHDGGYRDASGFDQQKLSLRHEYNNDTWTIASNISATNLDQNTAGYITGLNAYKNRTTAKKNPNPEAFRKAKSLRYWSRVSRYITDTMRWQITPYFRSLDMKFLMHFLPGKPLEENNQTSVGIQNGFYWGENSNTEFIAGFDLEYTEGSLKQTQANLTVGSPFLQATIPAGKQYDYDANSFMAAGFLQADFTVVENLHVTAGARLEYIKYDYTNNMLAGRTDANGTACGFGGCRYSRPESGENSYTAFSPKISILYNYTKTHQAYLNISHGFRAPQTTELYRLQRSQSVADLKKVSLKSIELGFRGTADIIKYTVAVYAMSKDNYIFQDSNFFNVSNGKSDHLGAEITLRMALSGQLSLQANATIARHRYNFDYLSNGINIKGNDIDTSPRHFGSAQLLWQPSEQLSTELEWVHTSGYFLDPENEHKYEGHNYLNLRITYTATNTLSLFSRINNLTNAKYAERADYTRFTEERYFPGKPITAFAGVKVLF